MYKAKKLEIFLVAVVVTVILVYGWLGDQAEGEATEWEIEQARLSGRADDLQAKLDRLDEEIAAMDHAIEGEKNRIAQIDSEREKLLEEIRKEEEIAGLREISGAGITIRIQEPERPYVQGETTAFLVYNPEYILSLISEINQANVRGIAINGFRFTNYSSLRKEQDCLRLDDQLLCGPDGSELSEVVLEVVGEPKEILNRIDFQGSTMGYLRDSIGLVVEIETGEVVLPKVDRLPEPKLIEPLE